MRANARTVSIVNSTGGSTVEWRPPGPIAIVGVAISASGWSATAGTDAAGAFLSTVSAVTAVADAASENLLAYLPMVAGVNGTQCNNALNFPCYREVRPGQVVSLALDAFASGSQQCAATLTYIPID